MDILKNKGIVYLNMTDTKHKFDNLEHEVLYEFLNINKITDNTEFDGGNLSGTSFSNAIEEIKKISKDKGYFFISYPKQKWYGFIVLFFKRLIRKFMRWYINPIIEKQNRYNIAVINILRTMNKNIEELKNEIAELRNK